MSFLPGDSRFGDIYPVFNFTGNFTNVLTIECINYYPLKSVYYSCLLFCNIFWIGTRPHFHKKPFELSELQFKNLNNSLKVCFAFELIWTWTAITV